MRKWMCIIFFLSISFLWISYGDVLEVNQMAVRYEKEFSANEFMGQMDSDTPYRVIEGNVPVLISAPHAVRHLRGGEIKLSEAYTGALALILQEKTGAWVIVKNRYDGCDDNYDETSEYKEVLKQIVEENHIEFVIDLHGMTDKHGYDIELGTGSYRNPAYTFRVKKFKEIFEYNGIETIRVDENFKAVRPAVISRFIREEAAVDSVQIEISRKYRRPRQDQQSFEKIIDALDQIIKSCLEE